MSSIPIGFRFEPTDEELLRGFLYPKLTGTPLPWDGIADRDVCGDNAEPWIVFSDADDDGYSPYWNIKKEGGTIKKTIYVFTNVTKAASNSKRISRRAGCGTWSGQTGPKNIYHSHTGEIIGTTRMLSFQSNKKDDCAANKDLVGHWIMHEYSLSDAALETATTAQTNTTHLVVCKITKCVKKESQHRALIQQTAAAAAAAQQQFYFPLEGNGGSSYHNDIRIPATAAPQQFYFAVEGNGGSSNHINDIEIPATAAGNVNKRAAGEELEQEGCKKQKYYSSGIGGEDLLDVEGCDLGDIDLDNLESLINFDFCSSTSIDVLS